jgi:hypothetical protein
VLSQVKTVDYDALKERGIIRLADPVEEAIDWQKFEQSIEFSF